MSVPRLSVLCLVLALSSSALGGFPFAQYPDFRGSAPSFTPHLIYGGNEDLAGFSYFTKDFTGGESEVVFLTGPNSDLKMNDEIASIKGQMSSWPFIKSDKTDDKEAKPEATENKDASTTVGPVVPEENKESSTPSKEEASVSTTAESKVEDKKDTVQTPTSGENLPANGAGFDLPYPIFRISGSAAYYPQASAQFSGFPEFPADYFRSQYLPLYNQYNSYQVPYVPSYPTLDTGYYSPGVFPSVYQTPFIIPSSVGGNSIGEKTGADVVSKIDRRLKPEETETTSVASPAESSDSDKKNDADSPSSEKGSDVPTSTETMVEKATAVSETASTTTEEVGETDSTTVVSDAVALP